MTSIIILILLILAAFVLGWLISRLLYKSRNTTGYEGMAGLIAKREAELEACRAQNSAISAKIASAKSLVAPREKENVATPIEANAPEPIVEKAELAPIMESFIADSNRIDDLKIIEGIGPKIEELLQNAKIKTFAQLASTSVADINSILEAAGPRYQMHNPSTWPQQSALCRDYKWTELKTLQDNLNKGKAD